MRYLKISGRLAGLCVLCGALIFSLGCDKMLAKYNISSAEKKVKQAQDYEATQYNPDKLEATQTTLNKARSELNAGDAAAAHTDATQAKSDAAELLEQTKIARANDLRQQASSWIQKATNNDANAINEQKFTEIKANNDTGNEQIGKEKWEKAIATFSKVVDDIKFLLQNLQNEAKQGYEASQQLKADLIKEEAPEYAPEKVVEITKQIDEMNTLITQDNNYRKALVVRDQIRQTWQEGITKTKEEKSKKQITEIENLLDQAANLGADLYAQQNFNTITKEFESLLTKFYDRNFDTVLAQAPKLKPRVDDLILETKMNAATAKMDAVQTAINNLTDGKADAYLPGSVAQLQSLLTEAKKNFDDKAYVESRKVAERALEVNQKIIDDFDNLAQQQISKANGELSAAESVFSRMQEIFDKPIPGDWTGADKSLEDSKQALKQELSAKLANAKLSLGVAQLKRRDDKNFAQAIETAKEVAATSENIQQQTYRVVAHNAILEISNQLTRFERDGGRQYAPAEVDKTHAMLTQTRQLLGDSKFRDAVRRAADTKAQLDIVTQQLERVANARIQNAQSAIQTAKAHRAEDFDNASYQQAIVALDRAKAALNGMALNEAINSAGMAENVATDASTRALRSWTEEYMAKADKIIATARTAGAERYAPERLQDAVNLRQNLQQLYDQTAYQAAVDTGRRTVDAADAALYGLINDAQAAVATAREYGAFQFEPKRVTEAEVSLRYAREALDKGDYANAELHAHNAENLGNKLQVEAKRDSFNSAMAALDARLKAVEAKGPGFYQVGDISKILGEMNSLRNQFDPKGYDDYAKRVEVLEGRLSSLVEKTPDVIHDLVIKMQDRLGEYEARGARNFAPDLIDGVERKVKYAQLDYRNEKYRSSYQNARDAEQLLDQIDLHLQERKFDGQLNQIFKDFQTERAKFNTILSVGPAAMVGMVVGADGRTHAIAMMQSNNPSQLRQNIDDLASRVKALDAPPTRQTAKNEALKMFNVARTAATNFEKMLILDQYSVTQARDIIQTAFLQMDNATNSEHKIMKMLQYPETELQPRGVERVVSMSER